MEPIEKSNRANRFSTEIRARAVRMILEHEHEYANQSAAIMAIAPKIGCGRDTLRRWLKQSDIDSGRKKDRPQMDLSRFSSGLFRAMFAMKEIENGKEIHTRVSA